MSFTSLKIDKAKRHQVHLFGGEFQVSPYRCFLKWWYPQNTPKWSFLVGKPMGLLGKPTILGNPHIGCLKNIQWNPWVFSCSSAFQKDLREVAFAEALPSSPGLHGRNFFGSPEIGSCFFVVRMANEVVVSKDFSKVTVTLEIWGKWSNLTCAYFFSDSSRLKPPTRRPQVERSEKKVWKTKRCKELKEFRWVWQF